MKDVPLVEVTVLVVVVEVVVPLEGPNLLDENALLWLEVWFDDEVPPFLLLILDDSNDDFVAAPPIGNADLEDDVVPIILISDLLDFSVWG